MVALVGRDAELLQLRGLISRSGARIVSLSGTGGVGKSALLVELMATESRQANVWTVDLSEAPPASRLLDEVARALGVPAEAARSGAERTIPRALASLMGGGARVLAVDHADACTVDASLLELLRLCSELTLIVASTLPLSAPAERIALQSLAVPPVGAPLAEILRSPAVRLFTDRAGQADPQFALDDATAASVAEICRQLGGLPLAIELAAARARLLPPRELVRRLAEDSSSGMALDILSPRATAGVVGIRAALAANRAMLTTSQDALLLALSRFRGPFPLEAAARVSGRRLLETLDDLDVLVELRLVEPMHEEPGELIFRMLPMVRAFGREVSADSDAVEARRLAYLRELVHEAAEAASSASASPATDHARALRSDVADALRSEAAADLNAAAEFATDSAAVIGDFAEGSTVGAVLDRIIASGTVDHLERRQQAAVWLWAANSLARSPEGSAQRELVDERLRRGIELVDDASWPFLGLQARLIAVSSIGTTADPTIAARAAEEGVQIAQSVGAQAWLARFEVWGGIIAYSRGGIDDAAALAISGMQRGKRIGDAHAIAGATGLLRTLPAGSHDPGVPVPSLEQALDLARVAHDLTVETFLLAVLSWEAILTGRPAEAARWCLERLALSTRRGWTILMSLSLLHAALIAAMLSDEPFAARILGVVQADQDRLDRSMTPATEQFFRGILDRLRAGLGEETFLRLLAEGSTVSMVDAANQATTWLSAKVASTAPQPAEAAPTITPREREVLALLAAGLRNKEIGSRLSVSAKTVMHHSVAIYRKLGVRGRTEATAFAIRHGLVDAP
jgi:predicted ATPase/DNA-binding CsgD family transcriptional regulator